MDTVPSPDESTEASLLLSVYTIAREYAGSVLRCDSPEDLAQDVVLECLVRLRAGAWQLDPSRLAGFVRRVAKRRSIDALRRQQRRAVRDAEHAREVSESSRVWMSPELAIEEQELANLHASTLASLSQGCRRSYVLVRSDETSYRIAAERLGVSQAAVCAHVVEAHRSFRRELSDYGIAVTRSGARRARQTVSIDNQREVSR